MKQFHLKNYFLPANKFERGFTALEMVIVAFLSSLLMTALLRFLVAGYPISRVTFLQTNSNETARVQLKRIAREIRQAKDSDTGAYGLVEMSPQRIIFYANVDGDAATERVRYELTGSNLERGLIEPSGTPLTYNVGSEVTTEVARSIRNGAQPIFTYYSGDYPADPAPLSQVDLTEVKYIEFELLIDADVNADPPPVEVKSQVQIRNLKSNLGETAS